jgi:catalase
MNGRDAVDRIEHAAGRHPGYRRLHARGGVFAGSFEASGALEGRTTARHLTGGRTDVLVRFSNGMPNPAADDRRPEIRGMALRFVIDGKAAHDLVAATVRAFPTRNAEGFVEIVELRRAAGGGRDALLALPRLGLFLAKHPEALGGLREAFRQGIAASFATTRYDGVHAFLLVAPDGRRRPFRYRLVPELGEQTLSKEEARARDRHFLLSELEERLATGPVHFALELQLADPGDPTGDPSKRWPDDREVVVAGRVTVTGRAADSEALERQVFDPGRVPDGVELSDDPVLRFRPEAYSVSAERRLAELDQASAPGSSTTVPP